MESGRRERVRNGAACKTGKGEVRYEDLIQGSENTSSKLVLIVGKVGFEVTSASNAGFNAKAFGT